MSTPIRQDAKQDTKQDIKSEGPEAYAPRRMRMQSAPESQVSPSQIPSPAPEGDPRRAEQSRQPPAAATESTRAADARIDDAIQAIIDLGRSFRDAPLAAADSYPPAENYEPERTDFADRRPYLSEPRWLDRDFEEAGRWRRSYLDPQMVPPPPGGTRRHIVAPLLFAVAAACAAVIGLTMISAFQPGVRWAKGASDRAPAVTQPAAVTQPSAVTQPANDVASEPQPPVRLVVENQRAFANEPLSLGVSVDSATGHESLLLGGLAAGTRLSAGARVSEASWQLSSHELNGVYVYAPKDFVGTMNTAIELLSPTRRLIESRAARLEWIAKPNPAPPTNRVGSGAAIAGRIQPLTPEAAAMMQRGRELLESGDVAASRLLFRHLADAGLADAALALAASYDPAYLARHNLIGVVGDETKARDWYQRASELGSTEASRFLARTVTK